MMQKYHSIILSIIFGLFVVACSQQAPKKPLRVGFNPWPGYEFIYLAKIKGFYKKHGVDVKLVELNALGDVRRAFEREQIDVMASTMVEMLIAAENTGRPLRLIAVSDASNGADMLLARKSIKTISQLKGKKIGVEGSTVDVLVAGAALRSVGLSFKDVTVIGKAQGDLVVDLETGQIDAMQTYPPYSVKLLKTKKYNKIFDTSNIPGLVVDTLSVDADVLSKKRNELRAFLKAYFEAFDYFESNPQDASKIMGRREGISGAEFREAIMGMIVFSKEKQLPYLKVDGVGGKILKDASEALYESGWLKHRPKIGEFFDGRVENLIY